MRLDIRGLFAGKWLKYSFKVEESVLENILREDGDLYGYDSINTFVDANEYEYNMDILKKYPDYVTPIKGGRLDIIIRTRPDILIELGDYRLENDNLTLLERLIKVLSNIKQYPKIEEYIEMVINVQKVGDALNILNQERLY